MAETIHSYEIDWMINKRPLVFNKEQLIIDYGKEDAQNMIEVRKKQSHFECHQLNVYCYYFRAWRVIILESF